MESLATEDWDERIEENANNGEKIRFETIDE